MTAQDKKNVTKDDIRDAVSMSLEELLVKIEERENKDKTKRYFASIIQILQAVLIPLFLYALSEVVTLQKDIIQLRGDIHESNITIRAIINDRIAFHKQLSKIHHTTASIKECTKCHNVSYSEYEQRKNGNGN